MDLNQVQKRIVENKIKHGFNTTNMYMEFCLLNGEVAEAFDAYNKGRDDLGSELADVEKGNQCKRFYPKQLYTIQW